ncbi:MAG: hypothetical protein HDS92_01240 [Bacteroidales bacterium]|nr:hypothetical protein [Bacteroidales bacterium]
MLDELKDKAASIMANEKVQDAVNKAKEFLDSDKGKEVIETAKEKIEGFVNDKLKK